MNVFSQAVSDTLLFRDPAYFQIAVEYYIKKKEIDTANYYNYYQLSCYYSLLKNESMAFSNLEKAIKKGAKGEDILTDSDLFFLKNNLKKWNEIDTLLKKQYLQRNPKIKNLNLGYELWLIYIEDQRFRSYRKNYKLQDRPSIDIEKHNENLIRVKEIIKKQGWPKYSDVGIEGGDAAFFVFQHDNAKQMKRILPLIIESGKAGEADLTKAALMIDRYLSYTEHVQIFGTQSFKRIKPGQKASDIPLQLYPIADEENLIKRRNSIGMKDFYENCKLIGVEYKPIEQQTDYKKIRIKSKWIKKGYLLD